MKWAAVLLVLVGCQASLGGDPATQTDGGGGSPDAAATDARVADAASDAALPDAQPCTAGDVNVEDPTSGHCYMLFQTISSWVDARMKCAALGPTTHLAVITTPEENALVTPTAGLLDVWLGGNDIDTEGVFVWISGEPFVWDNWREGEPNNSNGENCMILEGELSGTWDDRGCANQYAYLCERP